MAGPERMNLIAAGDTIPDPEDRMPVMSPGFGAVMLVDAGDSLVVLEAGRLE